MRRGSLKRIAGLDLLKAVAMLMVVSLHAGTWHVDFLNSPSASTLLQYSARLLSEGVPIFIMVNGYLLFAKSSFDLKTHMWKTIRILLLLVVWSLILAIFGSVINGTDLSPQIVWELFIGTKNGSLYTGPMWFMQAMFALYLIYPILRIVYDNSEPVFIFLFAVVCVFTVCLSALNMGVTLQKIIAPDLACGVDAYGWLGRLNPVANGSFVLFFMLGGMVKLYESKLLAYRAKCIAVGVAAFLLSLIWCVAISLQTGTLVSPSFDYSSVFTPFILVAFFMLFIGYRGGRLSSVVNSVGSNTLGIYLLHMIFIWLVSPFFVGTGFALRLVELVLVFTLSYIASFLLSKIPGGRAFVSMRTSKRL